MKCGKEPDGQINHLQRARDNASSPPETPKPMSLSSIVSFDCYGLRFTLHQHVRWDKTSIGFPMVGVVDLYVPLGESLEQGVKGGLITIAAFPIKQSASGSVIGFPYP